MKGYKEMFIKELNSDENKVAVSGVIVGREGTNLLIDDKTGLIQVDIENELELNDYIRVFGVLFKLDDKFVLKGDLIQNLNKINRELHRKVRELYRY